VAAIAAEHRGPDRGADRRVSPTIVVALNARFEYVGHIFAHDSAWSFRSDDTQRVIGIRASVANLCSRATPNVALKILCGVALWTLRQGRRYVRVESPMPVMERLLQTRLGMSNDNLWTIGAAALLRRAAAQNERATLVDHTWYPLRALRLCFDTSPELEHDVRALVREWRKAGATVANVRRFLLGILYDRQYDAPEIVNRLGWRLSLELRR
jgi:hypothetical protein